MSIFLHTLPKAVVKAEQELTVAVQTATQTSHEEQAILQSEFHPTCTQTLLSLENVLASWFYLPPLALGLISSYSFGEKERE